MDRTFSESEIIKAAAVTVEGPVKVPLAEYLRMLLATLWEESEVFTGKRPLGNGGWQFDVYKALVRAELIEGKIDADDDLMDCDQKTGDELVLAVIKRLVIKTNEYVPENAYHRMGL